MEVRFQYQAVARCHPQDLWHIFANIEEWHRWCDAFGEAGWVRGERWQDGSRFVIELKLPRRLDLEIVVLSCSPGSELVLLCHAETTTVQQWITFATDIYGDTIVQSREAFVGSGNALDPVAQQWIRQVNEMWLDGLRSEAERHCSTVAL